MSQVFVSYRRDDSADAAGRIHDGLVQRFGRENVVMDVDSIPLGMDFREFLSDAVGRCRVPQGEPERAARLLAAAEALRSHTGAGRFPVTVSEYQTEMAAVRAALTIRAQSLRRASTCRACRSAAKRQDP